MLDWIIFVLIVSLFGILVGLLYQTIKVENVNNKDTSEFIAVLKKQLGKKLKENQE